MIFHLTDELIEDCVAMGLIKSYKFIERFPKIKWVVVNGYEMGWVTNICPGCKECI